MKRRNFLKLLSGTAIAGLGGIIPLDKTISKEDITWTTPTWDNDHLWGIITSETGDPLIAYFDYGDEFTLTDGETFTIDWGKPK